MTGTPSGLTSDVVSQPPKLTPITAAERIETIDILRGFAIFGILSVNMYYFANPFFTAMADTGRYPGVAEQIARHLIGFFCEGKFYSLFSFLFGLGLAIQMQRAAARGARFARFFARRLLVLLGIGICHLVFLWSGDILIVYSLLGFVLLLVRRWNLKSLIILAFISHLVPLVFMSGLTALDSASRQQPTTSTAPTRATAPAAAAASPTTPATTTAATSAHEDVSFEFDMEAFFSEWVDSGYEVHSNGTYLEILVYRVQDYLTGFTFVVLFMWGSILGMFLFGLYAGRREILHDVSANREFIRRVMLWGLPLGVLGNLAYVLPGVFVDQADMSGWLQIIFFAGHVVGAPGMCFFYAGAITLLVQQDTWHRLLSPLAAVGRMALTNYLTHSLICTTVYNAYGFGLYGQAGYARGLLLTFAIYLAQIPLSNWWLSHFRFGPAEWFWRSLTYGKRQPMRRR